MDWIKLLNSLGFDVIIKCLSGVESVTDASVLFKTVCVCTFGWAGSSTGGTYITQVIDGLRATFCQRNILEKVITFFKKSH